MICVNNIIVSPGVLNMKPGERFYNMYAHVYPTTATCSNVVWYSSNASVASVGYTDGYIFANSNGTATIYAAATDGSGVVGTCTVYVSDIVEVDSITLNADSLTLEKNTGVQLYATICPSNASNKEVYWTSSNPEVATVSGDGYVCAVSKGNAYIIATAAGGDGVSTSCSVYVEDKTLAQAIKFEKNIMYMYVSEEKENRYEVRPTDANQAVTWSSGNIRVAKVDANGKVKATGLGSTHIHATAKDGSNCTGSFCVVVSPINSITISADNQPIEVGKSVELDCTISPSTVPHTAFTWSSDDECVASVCCSDSGVVVNAISPGEAIITAVAVDGSGVRGDCCINVTVPFNLKENTEYHLLCNGDSNKALRVGFRNVLDFKYVSPVRGTRLSYWNRQRWILKSSGTSKKLHTKLDDAFYLSNINNTAYVHNNSTNVESELTITPHEGNENLFTIKLANKDLFLTLVEGKFVDVTGDDADMIGMTSFWGEWREYDSSNISSQLWKFVEQPTNNHYGVDTSSIIDATTADELKNSNIEFVAKYYATLANTCYPNKLLTENEVTLLHNRGIKIISIYEDDGATFSTERGISDATRALEMASNLGQAAGSAIYFGVEETPTTFTQLNNYFISVKNTLDSDGRYKVGVYGPAKVCETIKDINHYADYSWLAQADGATFLLPDGNSDYVNYDNPQKYNIKQSEYVTHNSVIFDSNTAVGTNYGQW